MFAIFGTRNCYKQKLWKYIPYQEDHCAPKLGILLIKNRLYICMIFSWYQIWYSEILACYYTVTPTWVGYLIVLI